MNDRDKEEVQGYRYTLALIHEKAKEVSVSWESPLLNS
jgi:hypothetical protein